MTNLEERQIDVELLYTLRLIMTSLFRYSLLSFPILIVVVKPAPNLAS
jgi:hypothetical protein